MAAEEDCKDFHESEVLSTVILEGLSDSAVWADSVSRYCDFLLLPASLAAAVPPAAGDYHGAAHTSSLALAALYAVYAKAAVAAAAVDVAAENSEAESVDAVEADIVAHVGAAGAEAASVVAAAVDDDLAAAGEFAALFAT